MHGALETARPHATNAGVLVVTQHYPPDVSTTASLLATIAEAIARDVDVVVLSGTPDSAASNAGRQGLRVAEIPNREPPKGAMIRRSIAMGTFSLRSFISVLRHAKRGACVVVVTDPFLLPYFAVLAARLRGASTALIMHDLYPDVLVRSGMFAATSMPARFIDLLNGWLFRKLSAVVTIGRDMERHLMRYRGMERERIVFIPNWATLEPAVRPIEETNKFRRLLPRRVLIGLSGNLGFTHDPMTVFDAAARLADVDTVGFLLSGWGVGWERLKARQQEAKLPNVTLVERVPEADLDTFLAAADAWIIPYRKNMAGISVPSRLYNLLAIGRPVIALSEPDAEHSLMLSDDDIGWVVPPEDPDALAQTVRDIAANPDLAGQKGQRAVSAVAARYTREASTRHYRDLVGRLLTPAGAGGAKA